MQMGFSEDIFGLGYASKYLTDYGWDFWARNPKPY